MYEKVEDRNGMDVVEFGEFLGVLSEGGDRIWWIRRMRRGKNEVNGDMEREEDDEGMCVI